MNACEPEKCRGFEMTPYIDEVDGSKANAYDSQCRFQLYRQAIAPTVGFRGQLHAEVLLCLVDESGRTLRAKEFMPSVQRSGWSTYVDQLVVTAVTNMLSHDTQAGYASVYSVNLSGSSICDPRFESFLHRQLAKSTSPERLCFEITESECISDIAIASRFVTRMKSSGCRFALDDFGSGFCSMAYLKHLPVDAVKIDGQFIKDYSSNRLDREIVESILRLSSIKGIETIAEGVESASIHDDVRRLGIDYCQGYFVDRPGFWVELPSGREFARVLATMIGGPNGRHRVRSPR